MHNNALMRRWRTLAVAAALAVVAACGTGPPLAEPPLPPAALPAASQPQRPPSSTDSMNPQVEEEFGGQYRARAKTSYAMSDGVLAPLEEFADLAALRSFLAPQIDPRMRRHYPHLGEADADGSGRTVEELHNVALVAWIHAVKHESGPHGDNDFHVMLGSSAEPGAGFFLTAEASGLPEDGAQRAQLVEVRRQLLSVIGPCRCNGHFRAVVPPRRVRVSGSLFFDADHAIGAVGPKYAKPFTVWEIHPLLSIEPVEGGASAAATAVVHGQAATEASGATDAPAPPPQPIARPAPERGPTARCRDGTLSYARSHRGACSGHSGVAEWLR